MSADNILVIFEHEGKVRVHDVNYSDITSHDSWDLSGVKASEMLKNYILQNPRYMEVHKCSSEKKAVNFCRKYEQKTVVEYGHVSLIA